MANVQSNLMSIEAKLETPSLIARIIRFDLTNPVDAVIPGTGAHWLYRFLTPRLKNSRFCFPMSWNPRRFEPIGDVFHVPPEQTLHARADSGRFGAIICQLRPNAMQRWIELDTEWSEQHLAVGLDIRSRSIGNLLSRLEEEARHPGFASESVAELIGGQLAIELATYYKSFSEHSAGGGLTPLQLRLIEDRITGSVAIPTLAELAALCNTSVRQLTRLFRASQGCSLGAYVAKHRIEKAKTMLERGDSAKAVSYSMGFASPAAFGYAFRRVTGESPGAYRKRYHR